MSRSSLDRYAALDVLYAELPALECRGRCQESCGPIAMSRAERARIGERGVNIPPPLAGGRPLLAACPALSPLGTCSVYELRALICRLWGLVEAMACPWGCVPEGGWLDDATARRLLARAAAVGR